jgi:asparagine synthetase B (glutamine-hydrolysing)
MNLIYGNVYFPHPHKLDEVAVRKVKATYGCPQTAWSNREKGVYVYINSQSPTLRGYARTGKTHLAYLGAIHKLPDKSSSRKPLDDPGSTAKRILEEYRDSGISTFEKLGGDFAVIIYDEVQDELLLVADLVGLRSWYYTVENDRLLFGTTLSSVTLSQKEAITVEKDLEAFFLVYGFFPGNETAVGGVKTIPPGNLLTCRQGQVALEPYAQKQTDNIATALPPAALHDESCLIDTLYEYFMNAVEEQTATEKDVAVLLGGFDSALVASALKRMGKRVETFSFDYEQEEYNQPLTRQLSDYLGINHHWVNIGVKDIASGLQTYTTKFNSPTVWPNYVIQTEKIMRRVADAGIRFCYSGDGCDSLFYGYPGTFRRAVVYDLISNFKLTARQVRLITAMVGNTRLDQVIGHPYRIAMNLIRSMARKEPERDFITFRVFDETSLRWLRGDADSFGRNAYIEHTLTNLARPWTNLSKYRRAYIGKGYISPNKIKLVGCADSSGVPIISPYLHAGLKNMVMQIPDELLRPKGSRQPADIGKYILSKMAEKNKMLPKEVINQKKVAAIDAPIDRWFDEELKQESIKLMKYLPFEPDGGYMKNLFGYTAAEKLYMQFIATDKVLSYGVGLLLTYAAFCALTPGNTDCAGLS